MKKILTLGAALVAAVVLTFAVGSLNRDSSAQVGGSYAKTGTSAVGNFVAVFNATDSLLFDGEVVMSDTTAATTSNIRRIAVKRYDGTAINRMRVIGIVLGNIPSHANKGTGQVLTWGFHPGAYIDASNVAIYQPIKIGPTVGTFTKIDSLSLSCGYSLGRSSAATSTINTGPRYRYRVYFFGPRMAGSL